MNITAEEYVFALGAFIVLFFSFQIFQRLILGRLERVAERTKTDIDDTLIAVVRSLKPPFYAFLAFWIAFQFLSVPPLADRVVNAILLIWLVYQAVNAGHILINFAVKKRLREAQDGRASLELLGSISKGVLWALGILLVLSNLGVNITSLIAGLGIGGIAVALALQNILSDLFSSFAIHFDKPFVAGDFIVVGNQMGVVERIGIKTTRLRALQGEEIIISNQELTAARIQNFKRMRERRVVFSFGVTYGTSAEKLASIPEIVKGIVGPVEAARFDRAHLCRFGESALEFEVVYYVQTGDYNRYMDINQEIHLKLADAFRREGIEFAYPTRTIYTRE